MKSNRTFRNLAGSLAGVLIAAGALPADPAPVNRPAAAIRFARDIQPILASKCVRCHGPGTAEAGLRLDGRATATAMLDSGHRAIVAGRPHESELLVRVTAEEGARMPPEGEPLSPDEITRLRAWIAAGADWPDHWAYRPLETVAPPQSESPELAPWARTPIDRFLLAELVERGLRPSPPADRRTLIRRVFFDLIGLPPLPDEVDEFVSDGRPDAYERLVDRLLASPHYGERWARHWMDVVHYADSHGFEHDIPRASWPYRDYLVRSFNDDKPYPQFVREQVAGDALGNGDPDALAATGFLATGPWDLSALQAGNAESIDHTISQYLDRDDIVSTVMATFVSSTVHCARCHNHKFDPISQADYYGLQAVFAGIDKAHRPYDPDPAVARRRSELTARRAEILRQRDAKDATLLGPDAAAAVARWEERHRARKADWRTLDPIEVASANGATLVKQPDGSVLSTGARPEKDTYTIVATCDLKTITALRIEVLTDDSLPHRGPGRQDNGNLHLNEIVVTAAPAGDPAAAKPVALARPKADFDQDGWSIDKALDRNPATAWGIFPQVGAPHAAVFELAQPLRDDGPTRLTIELQQTHGGGHLIGRVRLSVGSMPPPLPLAAAPLPPTIAAALASPTGERSDEHRMLLAAHCLDEEAAERLAALPEQELLYCGTNQFKPEGGHRPAAKPRPIHILHRGDVTAPGAPAVPGALQCVPGLPGAFTMADPENEAARRVALAEWLADPRNVLTWRSIANRVWQFHFGRGLVDTPNDFGRMGSSPTHPDLLDWLAREIADRGAQSPSSVVGSSNPQFAIRNPQIASLKHLHRLIVTSAAYRQSSRHDAVAAELDGDNRLLWRMNRRRLDAESVRDAILQISGQLDPRLGGPPVRHFVDSRKFNLRAEADYEKYDVDDPGNRRRSLYRYVYRTIPDPFMAALDCPDGTQLAPKRNESITALQALATLNDKLVIRQSQHVAMRLPADRSLEDQATGACRLILGRAPEPHELAAVAQYARQFGLANACRFLLNTNEFLFVD